MNESTSSRNNPTLSPLEPIFARYPGEIPHALREQFLLSTDDSYDVVLKGKMHRVWYKPAWLRPLMLVLSKLGILIPVNGREVPMTLRIIAGRDRAGRPVHTYLRTFFFPGRPIRFRTTLVYDRSLGRIADMVGPRKLLFIVWRTGFRPPTAFTMDTERVAVRLGKRRIWLPEVIWRWLFGFVHHSQWTDQTRPDVIHIELMLWQPLVGYFFGYEGVFHLTREARGARASAEAPLEWTRDLAKCTM